MIDCVHEIVLECRDILGRDVGEIVLREGEDWYVDLPWNTHHVHIQSVKQVRVEVVLES